MHIKIKFDKNNPDWMRNQEYCKFYVKARLSQLVDRYKAQGYLYFNTIYDMFGLVWDPYIENKCFIYGRDGDLKIDVMDGELGDYSIDISA